MERLALRPQRLAARAQNGDARRPPKDRLGQCRRSAYDVFAAVEHNQRLLLAQPRSQS